MGPMGSYIQFMHVLPMHSPIATKAAHQGEKERKKKSKIVHHNVHVETPLS